MDKLKYSINSIKWDIELEKRLKSDKHLEKYGFKVYSQSDEDGIIEEIFNRIGTTNKKFIEFGVENGLESNSHYLLLKGWNGLWIEGSIEKYEEINKALWRRFEKGELANTEVTSQRFIQFFELFNKSVDGRKTDIRFRSYLAEGNQLFEGIAGIEGEIDFLSVDIDGNDIYVWENIKVVNPRVVCIEYNGKIAPSSDWVQPYNPNYIWDGTDFVGSSLNYINKIAKEKGYILVGTNVSGVNAFFIRNDLYGEKFYKSENLEDFYNPSRYDLSSRKIGHPSFSYIGDRNTEKLWYSNIRDIQYLTGFSHLETMEDGKKFCWTNSLESEILLYNDNFENYELEVLNYFEGMRIVLPDISKKEILLNLGLNKINIFMSNYNNGWLKLRILTDKLWIPKDSLDTRKLGVGIISKEINLSKK